MKKNNIEELKPGEIINFCISCGNTVKENQSKNKVSRCSGCEECYCLDCKDKWTSFYVCPSCINIE